MTRTTDEPGAMEPGSTEPGTAEPGAEGDYEAPVGTLFLLMIYVIVLAGMWVTMYWLLVTR